MLYRKRTLIHLWRRRLSVLCMFRCNVSVSVSLRVARNHEWSKFSNASASLSLKSLTSQAYLDVNCRVFVMVSPALAAYETRSRHKEEGRSHQQENCEAGKNPDDLQIGNCSLDICTGVLLAPEPCEGWLRAESDPVCPDIPRSRSVSAGSRPVHKT